MDIAMVGLGRMGMNMARRLLGGNHRVVVHNRSDDKIKTMVTEGAEGAFSLKEVVEKLTGPRIVWLMLPAGAIVDKYIDDLVPLLTEGDIIIEGGNSYYKDDLRRYDALARKGINVQC